MRIYGILGDRREKPKSRGRAERNGMQYNASLRVCFSVFPHPGFPYAGPLHWLHRI